MKILHIKSKNNIILIFHIFIKVYLFTVQRSHARKSIANDVEYTRFSFFTLKRTNRTNSDRVQSIGLMGKRCLTQIHGLDMQVVRRIYFVHVLALAGLFFSISACCALIRSIIRTRTRV